MANILFKKAFGLYTVLFLQYKMESRKASKFSSKLCHGEHQGV